MTFVVHLFWRGIKLPRCHKMQIYALCHSTTQDRNFLINFFFNFFVSTKSTAVLLLLPLIDCAMENWFVAVNGSYFANIFEKHVFFFILLLKKNIDKVHWTSFQFFCVRKNKQKVFSLVCVWFSCAFLLWNIQNFAKIKYINTYIRELPR